MACYMLSVDYVRQEDYGIGSWIPKSLIQKREHTDFNLLLGI